MISKKQEGNMFERKNIYVAFTGSLFYGSFLLLFLFSWLLFLTNFHYFSSLCDETFGMMETKVDDDDDDNLLPVFWLLE